MAKTNYRGYLQADRVPLKKYFYVLRPLLSVRWLERYGTAAPIEFAKLLHLIEGNHALLADIEDLLTRKWAAPEMGLSAPVTSINAFIEHELERLESFAQPAMQRGELLPSLNEAFHLSLHDAWA